MRWYFAANAADRVELLLEEGAKSILASFAYLKKSPKFLTIMQKAADRGCNVMIDSGAYTNLKRPGWVTLEEYTTFLKANGSWITEYIGLDDPRNHEITFRNLLKMRDMGLKPIVVDHVWFPWHKAIEAVYKAGGKVCWGGMTSSEAGPMGNWAKSLEKYDTSAAKKPGRPACFFQSRASMQAIARRLHERQGHAQANVKTTVHLLAVGARLRWMLPFFDIIHSFDSTSAFMPAGFGRVLLLVPGTDTNTAKIRIQNPREPREDLRAIMDKMPGRGQILIDSEKERRRFNIRTLKRYYAALEECYAKNKSKGFDYLWQLALEKGDDSEGEDLTDYTRQFSVPVEYEEQQDSVWLADRDEPLVPVMEKRIPLQLWGSPGGKSHIARSLTDLIPEHTTYVEPFAGGAAVFWKKVSSDLEVLSDLDSEIAHAFAFVRDADEEQVERMRKLDWVGSKERFIALSEQEGGEDPVARFHSFAYKTIFGFMRNRHRTSAVDSAAMGRRASLPDRFLNSQDRIQRVKVHHSDYLKVLETYDGPDTFFFLDPPYVHAKAEVGEGEFDHRRFWEAVKVLKGKFLMTYDVPPPRFAAKGLSTRRCTHKASRGHHGGSKDYTTFVIANFPLPRHVRKDEDGEEMEKRQPFGTFGGSFKYAKAVVALIPPDTATYVEPFAGGAAVLHAKEKAGKEVIADTCPDVVFLHRFIKKITQEVVDELRKRFVWKVSQKSFQAAVAMEPKDDLERFYKLVFIRSNAFMCKPNEKKHIGGSRDGVQMDPDKYLSGAERLKKVTILHQDYKKTVEDLDGPDTFFFLDPPYPGEWHDKNAVIDVPEFAAVLQTIKGRFVAVLNDTKENADAFKTAGRVFRLQIQETAGAGGGKLASRLFCTNLVEKFEGESDIEEKWTEADKDGGVEEVCKFTGSPRSKYGTHGSKGFKGNYAKAWRVHFSNVGGGAVTAGASGALRGTVRRTEMIAASLKAGCKLTPADNIGPRSGSASPLDGSFPESPSDYGLSKWAKPGDDDLTAEDIRLSCADLETIKRAAVAEIKWRIRERERRAKGERCGPSCKDCRCKKGVGATHHVPLLPMDKNTEDQRIVFGVVLEPGTVDAQGDTIAPEEIERAAHIWLAKYQERGLMHRRLVNKDVEIYESYVAPQEMTIGGKAVLKGTWLLMYHILSDQIWEDVKSGKLTGFSMGGYARRVKPQ